MIKKSEKDNAGSGAKVSNKRKISKMRVLDPGRAQTIAITLSQLPEIPLIIDSIKKLDTSRLSLANILALAKLYPTADEQRAISGVIKTRLANPANNEKSKLIWDKPESLFIALSKIPCCTLRLSCWSAQLGYDERISDMLTQLEQLLKACSDLRSSSAWKLVLGTILAVGNYMNGGTKRGRADGFKIEAILKLKTTKLRRKCEDEKQHSTTSQMKTMLDLVTHQCFRANSDIKAQLSQELSHIKKASKIDLQDLKAKVAFLSSEVPRLSSNYRRVVETTNNDDVRKGILVVLSSGTIEWYY